MKLTNAERNRILARSLFVDSEYSQERIAEVLIVSKKTVENYQSRDKAEGHDWLTLRAAKHIKQSTETKENMYSMFVSYMYQSLKEIRENEKLNSEDKAQMIVSLGDSFSKMGKVARQEDPEAYKFGIIKHTVQTILLELKDVLPQECMETVIQIIHDKQEELANVSI